MGVYELKLELNSDKTKKKNESQVLLDKEKILCNHCKRTASNGIRCLGICVADNDYQKNLTLKNEYQNLLEVKIKDFLKTLLIPFLKIVHSQQIKKL